MLKISDKPTNQMEYCCQKSENPNSKLTVNELGFYNLFTLETKQEMFK